jgi:spartin
MTKWENRSVAKGMVVGKAPGGGNLVVGGGDGGAIPPEAMPDHQPGSVGNQNLSSVSSGGQAGSGTQVGFGNYAADSKSSGLGEPLGS